MLTILAAPNITKFVVDELSARRLLANQIENARRLLANQIENARRLLANQIEIAVKNIDALCKTSSCVLPVTTKAVSSAYNTHLTESERRIYH